MKHLNLKYSTFIFLLFILGFVSNTIEAQSKIEKVVICKEDNIPLENVHVISEDTLVFTESNGKFNINVFNSIQLFHVGYESIRFVNIEKIPDTIKLVRKSNVLDEVTINAERKVNEIEKEQKYWIKDFEIIYNHLVVLKKTHFRGKTKLSLHDLRGNFVDDLNFEHEIRGIELNCIGQLFLQYDYGYVMIFVAQGKLVTGQKYSKRKYEQVFKKCVLYHNQSWIYEFEKFNGLERNIVSIKNYKDSLIKRISLPHLLQLRRNYRGQAMVGSYVSTITVSDAELSRDIRRMQATSSFLDKVLLKAHQKNSFAQRNDGILVANTIFDTIHYFKPSPIQKHMTIKKRDYIFNNTDKSKVYFFQLNGLKEYSIYELDEDLNCQKLIRINQHVNKIKIHDSKIYYLIRDNSKNSVKTKILFENI